MLQSVSIMANIKEGGQPQPEPVVDRRRFVKGAFLLGAGLAEMAVAGIDKRINARQSAEQGQSDVADTVDNGVAFIGFTTAFIGILNMEKASSDHHYQRALREQKMKPQYPGLNPDSEKHE
jgi:hypothetical protein